MRNNEILRLLWVPLACAAMTSGVTFAADPPPPRNRAEVEAVLSRAPPALSESELRTLAFSSRVGGNGGLVQRKGGRVE
jgi:hypothetical protein